MAYNVVGNLGNTLNTTRCAFLAFNANTATNVTGDNTLYTCQFDTESFDQGSNFASNTFTAPVTGTYVFSYGFYVGNVGAGHTQGGFSFVATSKLLYAWYGNLANVVTSNINLVNGSCIVQMTAGDTANCKISVSGSTKTISWVGGANLAANPPYFGGYLLC